MDTVLGGRAWIEVSREALRRNVEYLRSQLPKSCKLMPAVKANGYGHGGVLVARVLNELGVDAFCVASAQEGAELREQGIFGEILVLGCTQPEEFPLLLKWQLTQTVVDYPYALELNAYGRPVPVHIAVDTGMHRLGERSEHLEDIAKIFDLPNLQVAGMYTHLCVSDSLEPEAVAYTKGQREAFLRLARELQARGCEIPKLHMQASYGVLLHPECAGDYARVGIALYGVLSTKDDTRRWGGALSPVLTLKTRVASVRRLYAGEGAGYGLDYTDRTDRTIAALAIGYADGISRSLSGGKGAVLIRGRRVPIVGRICMDQMLVDVSEIPDVQAGDTAVLIGRDGGQEISACDLAEAAGTITNETLSQLGKRLERFLVD